MDEADIADEVDSLVIRRLNLFSSTQRKNIDNMWSEIYTSKKFTFNLAALEDMPEEEELDADDVEMELEIPPPPKQSKNLIKLNLSGITSDMYEEPPQYMPPPVEPIYIPNILEEPYVEEE